MPRTTRRPAGRLAATSGAAVAATALVLAGASAAHADTGQQAPAPAADAAGLAPVVQPASALSWVTPGTAPLSVDARPQVVAARLASGPALEAVAGILGGTDALAGLADLTSALTDARAYPSLVLTRPLEAPITSPMGPRFHPYVHRAMLHTGIDLGAACGTPVKASASGYVSYAGVSSSWGGRVIVDHGVVQSQTLSTGYAHLSVMYAKVGDFVAQGQVIGLVGTTGWSTGCHLHWDVWKDGQYVNGAPYYQAAAGPRVTIPAAWLGTDVNAHGVEPALPAKPVRSEDDVAPPVITSPLAPKPAQNPAPAAPTTVPTTSPTTAPTTAPTGTPTTAPTGTPSTTAPTGTPSTTTAPTGTPSTTTAPTDAPTGTTTAGPTDAPSGTTTTAPTGTPTTTPSGESSTAPATSTDSATTDSATTDSATTGSVTTDSATSSAPTASADPSTTSTDTTSTQSSGPAETDAAGDQDAEAGTESAQSATPSDAVAAVDTQDAPAS